MKRKHDPIESIWRFFIGMMIFAGASTCVLLIYSAFFAAMAKQWPAVSAYTAMATGLTVGVAWLCYHREDLVGLPN